MAEVTVTQFADVLKVPVERLITQLDEAGIKVTGADDIISDEAKMELLTHLRRAHGRVEDQAAPRRITLQRKSQSEIKLASPQGRARTVNVEVRRKRTYLNRTVLEEEQRHRQEELDRQRQADEAVRMEAERREQDKRAAEQRERERLETESRRKVDDEARLRAEEEARRQAEVREREKTEQPARHPAPAPAHAPKARVEAPADERRGTKYGRQELHVASGATFRFRRRSRSASWPTEWRSRPTK